MPIVAVLFREGPLPFAVLAGQLSASRDTLTETLAKLEAEDVIARGRPGRKTTYQLTELGNCVGDSCAALVDMIADTDVLPVALKKWPMLVVVALGRGATRYNEAKTALPGITARALAIALKDLQGIEMVERTVEHGYPPAPSYVLSAKGASYFPALDSLCLACAGALERPAHAGARHSPAEMVQIG